MKTQTIEYKCGDTTCHGYLAYDETKSGVRPGILVVHEWYGLSEHPKKRTEMLAELGFIAFAADIYGDGKIAKDPKEAGELAGAIRGDNALFRGRLKAALETLSKQPNVNPKKMAAIGFCFGGSGVLELARSGTDIAGVVSFHGNLSTSNPVEKGKFKAKVLICNGADDPMVPLEQIATFENEMRNVGADWQLINYGGAKHAFTNSSADKAGIPALAYNKAADERSWAAMQIFFEELFGKV